MRIEAYNQIAQVYNTNKTARTQAAKPTQGTDKVQRGDGSTVVRFAEHVAYDRNRHIASSCGLAAKANKELCFEAF